MAHSQSKLADGFGRIARKLRISIRDRLLIFASSAGR
jgi:hypothetical protein